MARIAREIIEEIYLESVTCTSGHFNYLQLPQVKDSIRDVRNSSSRSNLFPALDDDDIRDIILLALELFDVPTSLQGILEVKYPLMITINRFLQRIGGNPALKLQIMAVVEEWLNTLTGTLSMDIYTYKTPPLVQDSPLMYFHFDAYNSSLISGTCPLYEAYGWYLHRKIRLHDCKQPAKATNKYNITVARCFFEHLPQMYKLLQSYPEYIPDSYINEAFAEWNRINKGSTEPLSHTALTYKRVFKELLASGRIRKRKLSKRSRRSRASEIDEEDEYFFPDGSREGYRIRTIDQEDKDDHDYPVPENRIELPGKGRILDRIPPIKRGWADIIHLRNFIFFWDKKYLNLFHYTALYMILSMLQGISVLYDMIVLYVFILIHTGLPYKALIHLTTAPRSPKDDLPVLRKIGDRYFIHMPLIIDRDSKAWDGCRLSLDAVLIPLTNKICALIDRLPIPKSGPVFAFAPRPGEKKIHLDIDAINKVLERCINKSPFRKYDLRITVARISRSFPALYCSRFGLDPIVAAFIKADKREQLYKAQAHYVFLPINDFYSQYMQAFNKVDHAILANIAKCVQSNIISDPYPPASPISILFPDTTHMEQVERDEGIGSQIIPSHQFIRHRVEKLRAAVYAAKDKIQRFNRLAVYVYLCLQFTAGLRPRNAPELFWLDYDTNNVLTIIRDKESRRYHEERILRLPELTHDLLMMLRQEFNRIINHFEIKRDVRILESKRNRMFVFFNDDGSTVDFTIARANDLLRDIGADFGLPDNMPRHFLKNELYHKGICNDIIDAWLGHSHDGREILNYASSSCLAQAAELCIPVISTMLEEIGFHKINLRK
jgi:hypothetical protein